MSRSCAKPTCSSPAESWFDMLRESRQVTRSASPTDQGMALCQVHADRFTVPVGWSLSTPSFEPSGETVQPAQVAPADAANRVVEPNDAQDANETKVAKEVADVTADDDLEIRSEPPAETTQREHDRDNPWFVPDSHVIAAEDSERTTVSLTNPSAGSLLHRAFHGPTSMDESSSAAVEGDAPIDELGPRRRARSSSDDAEEEATGSYHETELPFPPHTKIVAVS